MTTSDFDTSYRQLNAEQKRAVDTIEGPVMVIAGPGTGKTQVLTLRIANILKETQVEPENILALTFTESGVAAMRKRLAEIIGAPAYRAVIATFHGFANDIIQRYPDTFPHIIGREPSTEMEQIDIMQTVIDRSRVKILKPFGDPYHYVKPARSAIKDLKKEGISPQDFAMKTADERIAFEQIDDLFYEKGAHKGKMKGKYQKMQSDLNRNAELAVLYEGYQKELAKRKRYDYEDMLTELRNALLKNDELRLLLQEQYQYFLVDEHQDTNRAQNNILELLASFHPNPNVFIVGDEKQAIFRFQGASLENFNYFKKIYPAAKMITLKASYRSSQSILDVAGTLLTAQQKYKNKPVQVAVYSSPDVERYGVAMAAKHAIETGVPPHEIAVLYRENREAFPLTRVVGKLGIPYVIESDLDVLEDPSVRKLLLILRAINSYGEPLPLIEALHVDFLDVDPFEIYELAKAGRNPYQTPLGSRFRTWRRIADNESLEMLFEDIIHNSGLLASITEVDTLEKIRRLYEQAAGMTLADFIRYIDTLREHKVTIKYAPHVHTDGKIHLMTAHRAKGLEFEQVYIINAVNTVWGNRRKFSSFSLVPSVEPTDEDERNLFYVALTRAKKEIYISYTNIASQFVTELKPELVEHVDVAKVEREYEKNPIFFLPEITKSSPSIRDRGFLKNLFLSRGFSATHLNNYLECPWKYFYINLLRIPQAPTPSQYYGTAMHRALEHFQDKAKMLQVFQTTLERFKLEPAYLERGLKALEGYWDIYHESCIKNVLTEFNIKGIELTPEIRLTGKLDKIELLDGNSVNVVDYKTGKPKSRNAILKGNEMRQLTFYKLLLNKFADGKYNMQSGIIDFVEPNDSGRYKREVFEISSDEVAVLEQQIRHAADEIFGLKFWDRRCDDKECQWCGLRRMMK